MNEKENERIKLVIGITDFRVGGAQKLVAEVLSQINQEKFDVTLVTLMQFPEQDSFYANLPESVRVYKINFRGFKDISAWRELWRLMKDVKPNVAWSNLFFANTVFRLLKPLCGYVVISIEQNTYVWKTKFQKLVDRILARLTYRIVGVSEYVIDFTAKDEGIPKEKFTLIHNGVPVYRLQEQIKAYDAHSTKLELGFTESDKLIINIGQLIYQKNQALLIDSFKIFSQDHPEYRLLILGEGKLRTDLEKQIAELGLEEKVQLLGIQKEVPKFHQASEFFVLSSRFEGFPLVVVEALACGLPIISTPVAGSAQYLVDGENGFLANETKEDIAKKMSLLAAQSEAERQDFVTSAQAVAAQFDIAVIAGQYEELFKEAATKG